MLNSHFDGLTAEFFLPKFFIVLSEDSISSHTAVYCNPPFYFAHVNDIGLVRKLFIKMIITLSIITFNLNLSEFANTFCGIACTVIHTSSVCTILHTQLANEMCVVCI